MLASLMAVAASKEPKLVGRRLECPKKGEFSIEGGLWEMPIESQSNNCLKRFTPGWLKFLSAGKILLRTAPSFFLLGFESETIGLFGFDIESEGQRR